MKNIDNMDILEKLFQEGRLMEEIKKFVEDESIPSFPSDRFFTDEQWDALIGEIPMTQEMFDNCLYICDSIDDGVNFHRIVEQFPELDVKYPPEVCARHKAAHDKFKAEYLEKFGSNATFFLE